MKKLAWILMFFLVACGSANEGNGHKKGSADAVGTVKPAKQPTPISSGPSAGPGGKEEKSKPAGVSVKDAGTIALFDADDEMIGYKVSSGQNADVFLPDGKRVIIEMETGEIKPLLYDFFCLYVSSDCSGACYVYDSRWLNTIVFDSNGQTMVASRYLSDQGSKTMLSYVKEDGSCFEQTVVTEESYEASPYSELELPLSAPLYWGTTE